ncbi:hypothetical protein L1887_27315 [Cichorium endivia]|nr:hypothetical protein L1887_27315 [Cichorium endivia]
MATQNRNYRGWTDNEENKLVEALVNMVNAGGYKADNGFKAGYLAHLEQVLKESLPESGLSGKPHIESKIKVMKKDWQVVYDMLHGSNTSGFGYDSVNKCVTADDTVWDEYLKVHGSAAKWRNKKFRHFEDLCTVFGKDRAQGNKARDFVEMEKEADIKEQTQHLDDDSDDIVASTQTPSNNDNVQSQETQTSTRNKKRKAREDPMVKGFNDAVACLERISNKISKGVEREEDLDNKRTTISSEISKMQTLTQVEKFKAIRKMGDDKLVNTFWNVQESEREIFIKWVLEE